MNQYPLLYLQPVFDSIVSQLPEALHKRFSLHGFHYNSLKERLEELEAPWIVLGDAQSFAQLRQDYPSAPFFCFVNFEGPADITPDLLEKPQLLDYSVESPDLNRVLMALNRVYSLFLQEREVQRLSRQIEVQHKRLKDLNAIGTSLSTERNLDTLLDKILSSAMEMTHADSGSLYLVEKQQEEGEEKRYLRFKWARNCSLDIDFSEFTIEMNEGSIAGSAAVHSKLLNIPDVYHIGDDVPYGFNKSFDQNTGYRSKSMFTVPMKNPQNQVIGILQLINKKRRGYHEPLSLGDEEALEKEIVEFSVEDEQVLSSLASQAAVSIENARLYASIQSLFEGFIRASVHAIEARDPTTSGHSERVAVLTVELAKSLNKVNDGPYAEIKFTRNDIKEINYASLLHDFGKIGVRENVLVKAEKLYPYELKDIEHRFRLIQKELENQFNVKKLNFLLKEGPEAAKEVFPKLEAEYQEQRQALKHDLEIILQANRPSILDEDVSLHLQDLEKKHFQVDEDRFHLITPFELSRLSIKKGSLDPDERKEIESHVTHTYEFLRQIPWTSELKGVPSIAYAHHEKLNGRGYPLGLPAAEIPIQSKMMTISDIYDALTASDRPYKKAMPVQRALDILGFEVKDGMLDAELYRIFLETRVYERIQS